MSSLQFDSTSIQNILITLVVICAIVYGYLELRKMDNRIEGIENKLKKMLSSEQTTYATYGNKVSIPNTQEMEQSGLGVKSEFEEKVELEQQGDLEQQDNLEQQDDLEQQELEDVTDIQQNIIEEIQLQEIDKDDIKKPKKHEVSDIEKGLIDELSSTPVMNGLFIAVETSGAGKVEEINDTNGIEEITDKPDTPVVEKEDESTDEKIMDKLEEIRDGTDDIIIPKNVDTMGLSETDPVAEGGYEEYTIRELKDILTDMDLPTSGNKTKLIQRIVSNKK